MENTVLTVEELRKQDPERYFRDNLELEEFENLKTLVEGSNRAISWKELGKECVVKLDGRKVEGIYWKQHLILGGSKIKTLRKIKIISGGLNCEGEGFLEDLGDLEEIQGNGNLNGTKIKSLGKLKRVRGGLGIGMINILEDLGDLEIVGCDLEIRYTKIKSLGKLKRVRGNLDCRKSKYLEDLGELEEVGGYLDLDRTKIKSLGKFLKKVGQDLHCNMISLGDIGELEYVGGRMKITGGSIKSKIMILQRIKEGKLKVEGEIIPYGDMNRMYEGGKLNYERFREKYGDNIRGIEDEETKEIVRELLMIEYNLTRERLKEKGKKIQKENEGKKLTEEEKKNVRQKAMKLGKELGEIIEKIESFGLKLEDL